MCFLIAGYWQLLNSSVILNFLTMHALYRDGMRPICFLRRREVFSASHRLHCPEWSDETNKEIYGKCNHVNGHGHNYELVVALRGATNAAGMVMNIAELKEILKTHVLDLLDHRNIDKDVPEFAAGLVSTTENLAVFIFNKLQAALPDPNMLYEVELHETNKNSVIYRGEYRA